MNRLFISCAVLVTAFYAQVATAGPIHTSIIPTGGTALTLTINSGRLLKIYDFVHDGADAGMVSLTKNSQTSNVMNSISVSAPEFHRTFFVSGASTVTINPPASGNLTISYQFVDNTD